MWFLELVSIKASVLQEVTSCGVWERKKEWCVPRDWVNSLEITWLGHVALRADWPSSSLPVHTCSSLTQRLMYLYYYLDSVGHGGSEMHPCLNSFSLSFSSCAKMTSRKKVLLKVIILGDSGWVTSLVISPSAAWYQYSQKEWHNEVTIQEATCQVIISDSHAMSKND